MYLKHIICCRSVIIRVEGTYNYSYVYRQIGTNKCCKCYRYLPASAYTHSQFYKILMCFSTNNTFYTLLCVQSLVSVQRITVIFPEINVEYQIVYSTWRVLNLSGFVPPYKYYYNRKLSYYNQNVFVLSIFMQLSAFCGSAYTF